MQRTSYYYLASWLSGRFLDSLCWNVDAGKMSIMRLLFPGEQEEAASYKSGIILPEWQVLVTSKVLCSSLLSSPLLANNKHFYFSLPALLSLFTLIKDGDTARTKTFVGKTLYCFNIGRVGRADISVFSYNLTQSSLLRYNNVIR